MKSVKSCRLGTARRHTPGLFVVSDSPMFIEEDALINKILKHLGLWEIRIHDPPQLEIGHTPTIETELTCDYTYSQLPPIDYWTQ